VSNPSGFTVPFSVAELVVMALGAPVAASGTLFAAFWVKVAVVVLAALIVRAHEPMSPLQAPLQPLKLHPEAGVGFRVTLNPLLYV
jgi:hypothetical protein